MAGPFSMNEIVAIAAGGAGIVLGLSLRLALRRLRTKSPGGRWRGATMETLAYLLPWAVVILGAWVAVLSLARATSQWRSDANHALVAVVVLATTLAAARTATEAVRAGVKRHSGISESATIFLNITRVVVLAIGLLILLSSVGVSITPLLTALGVGGLAVALALQDTLTNLFAGIHILASGKVQAGDFIELDTGLQGYVVDTNWRNTIIRQLPNNLIIVPNAKLASSTLINFARPEQETSVLVQVGVAYGSDLDQVERVTCEVGRDVMKSVDGAVPAHEPSIRYHTFGDSSIDFSVILRAAEVTAQYLIIHEFIKRLHRRYLVEGIEIPFPMRTIVSASKRAESHPVPNGRTGPEGLTAAD